MIIKVNNIDISSRLISFKTLNEMNSDSLLIGNAVCKKLELKLDNHDGELTPLLDYPFFVSYSENKALGKFNVYEKPEKYTGELSLSLYDNMYFLNQRFDSKLDYVIGTTIKEQLDEMNLILETLDSSVQIDYSTLSESILNKVIQWCDNTIFMRNYIGWIAELDGGNAFVSEDGLIVFRPLGNAVYDTIDIESYEKGELVVITRVCFDDGILKLEVGESVGNTLYLSSNNAYVDSETDLSPLLIKYQGLSFYSIKDVKMANIENLYLTDLVNYNNEFIFMPLSVDEIYSGGQYSIATINGEVNTINQEIVINKVDPTTRIRRIQTIVDQNSQSLSLLAQDLDEEKKKISQIKLDLDGITSTVSNSATKGDLEDLKETIVEQTDEKWSVTASKVDEMEKVTSKMEFTTRGLEVYGVDQESGETSRTSTLVAEDRFSVLYDGKETTQIYKDLMKVKNIEVEKTITHGPFEETAYDEGIIERWVGYD